MLPTFLLHFFINFLHQFMEPSYTTRKWALCLWQKLSKFFLVYFSFDSASGLPLWHALFSCLHKLIHLLFYGLRGLGHGEPGLSPPLQGWAVTLRITSTYTLAPEGRPPALTCTEHPPLMWSDSDKPQLLVKWNTLEIIMADLSPWPWEAPSSMQAPVSSQPALSWFQNPVQARFYEEIVKTE